MQTLEYTTVDKSTWEYAQNEPDKKQWQHKNGLACLIVRNPMGALCGYVGVPKEHPCYNKPYDEVDVDVHGGLTFSDPCYESDNPAKGICHISEEEVWWLGFDCAHCYDITPKPIPGFTPFWKDPLFGDCTYKDFEYVTNEVNKLAVQLATIKKEEKK